MVVDTIGQSISVSKMMGESQDADSEFFCNSPKAMMQILKTKTNPDDVEEQKSQLRIDDSGRSVLDLMIDTSTGPHTSRNHPS